MKQMRLPTCGPTFIRGLWGDDKIAKHAKSLVDAAANVFGGKHPKPVVTYTYGRENHYFMGWLRTKPISMGDDAVRSWGSTEDRNPTTYMRRAGRKDGDINWGVSIWRHKLEIIRRAVETYGEVVWLDWDCWMVKPLPADFWETMQKGQPLQASVLKFSRTVLPWRNDPGSHCSQHGAFIYCREIGIMDELLALSYEFPAYLDEVLMVKWAERRWGERWDVGSEQRWVDEGYEPRDFGQRYQYRKNFDPVFAEGPIYPE